MRTVCSGVNVFTATYTSEWEDDVLCGRYSLLSYINMLVLHAYIEICKNRETLLTSAASTAYMQDINIHEGHKHACRA